MTHDTEYNNWPLPDKETTDWADDYYALVEGADTQVFRSGPATDRPRTAPDGAWWFDPVDDQFYQYVAAANEWVARATGWDGYELAFGIDPPETNRYILLEEVDPEEDVVMDATVTDVAEGDPVVVEVTFTSQDADSYGGDLAVTVGGQTQTDTFSVATEQTYTYEFDGLGAGVYDWEVEAEVAVSGRLITEGGTVAVERTDTPDDVQMTTSVLDVQEPDPVAVEVTFTSNDSETWHGEGTVEVGNEFTNFEFFVGTEQTEVFEFAKDPGEYNWNVEAEVLEDDAGNQVNGSIHSDSGTVTVTEADADDVQMTATTSDVEQPDPVVVDVEFTSDDANTWGGNLEVTVGTLTQTDTWAVTNSNAYSYTFDSGELGAGTHAWEAVAETETGRTLTESGSVTVHAESEPGVTVIDTFAGGTFAAGWGDTQGWSTITDTNAVDDYAAHSATTGIDVLSGNASSFDEYFSEGGHFLVFDMQNTSGDWAGVRCNWGNDPWWTLEHNDVDGTLEIWEVTDNDSTWTVLDSVSLGGADTSRYLTYVAQWNNELLAIDAYQDGAHIATAGSPVGPEQSDSWGFRFAAEDSTARLSHVEFHEEHPYTGRHHTEPPTIDEDDGGDPSADVVNSMETSIDLGEWDADYWNPGSWTTVSSPAAEGSGSTRSYVPSGQRGGPNYHYVSSWDIAGMPHEAHVRYWQYLPSAYFPSNDHFKLPGIAGTGRITENWPEAGFGGNQPTGENGWSARFEIAAGGTELNPYVYHMDTGGSFGDYGPGANVSFDTWHQIDQYVRLNDPGQSNGLVRWWLDGNLVGTMDNLRFRTTTDVRIESIWHAPYHGGNADVSLPDMYLYHDFYHIWWGEETPP